MKIKKIALMLVLAALLVMLSACGKKCANGCGRAANPDCMAGMCDQCCDYWMGLNGCSRNH